MWGVGVLVDGGRQEWKDGVGVGGSVWGRGFIVSGW